MDNFYKWFPGIQHVRSPNAHKVSSLVEHKWINMEKINESVDLEGS